MPDIVEILDCILLKEVKFVVAVHDTQGYSGWARFCDL